MDDVPDMDSLLDELEASEPTELIPTSAEFARSSNRNNNNGNAKLQFNENNNSPHNQSPCSGVRGEKIHVAKLNQNGFDHEDEEASAEAELNKVNGHHDEEGRLVAESNADGVVKLTVNGAGVSPPIKQLVSRPSPSVPDQDDEQLIVFEDCPSSPTAVSAIQPSSIDPSSSRIPSNSVDYLLMNLEPEPFSMSPNSANAESSSNSNQYQQFESDCATKTEDIGAAVNDFGAGDQPMSVSKAEDVTEKQVESDVSKSNTEMVDDGDNFDNSEDLYTEIVDAELEVLPVDDELNLQEDSENVYEEIPAVISRNIDVLATSTNATSTTTSSSAAIAAGSLDFRTILDVLDDVDGDESSGNGSARTVDEVPLADDVGAVVEHDHTIQLSETDEKETKNEVTCSPSAVIEESPSTPPCPSSADESLPLSPTSNETYFSTPPESPELGVDVAGKPKSSTNEAEIAVNGPDSSMTSADEGLDVCVEAGTSTHQLLDEQMIDNDSVVSADEQAVTEGAVRAVEHAGEQVDEDCAVAPAPTVDDDVGSIEPAGEASPDHQLHQPQFNSLENPVENVEENGENEPSIDNDTRDFIEAASEQHELRGESGELENGIEGGADELMQEDLMNLTEALSLHNGVHVSTAEDGSHQVTTDSTTAGPSGTSTTSTARLPDRRALVSERELSDMCSWTLTESELQLGKVKPYWIPDPDTPCCLLCNKKFSVIRRRHHCRSCGRVLCHDCCAMRAQLHYLENREARVCEPCSKTLQRIRDLEESQAAAHASNNDDNGDDIETPGDSRVNDAESSNELGEVARSAKKERRGKYKKIRKHFPWLKIGRKGGTPPPAYSEQPEHGHTSATRPSNAPPVPPGAMSDPEVHDPSVSGLSTVAMSSDEPTSSTAATATGTIVRKSVTFSDGIRPGSEELDDETVRSSALRPPKKKRSTGRSGQRMAILRLTQELESFLPKPTDTTAGASSSARPLFIKGGDRVADDSVPDTIRNTRKLDVVLAIKRNLRCRVQLATLPCCYDPNKPVWVLSTDGMMNVASNELLVCIEADLEPKPDAWSVFNVPLTLARLFERLYELALKGVRFRHLQCVTASDLYLREGDKAGSFIPTPYCAVLTCRPSVQCLDNLPVPSSPFVCLCLLRADDVCWAKVLPVRLLLRIGLLMKAYPYPLINVRDREPLFGSIQHTVLNIFVDFTDFKYSVSYLSGATAAIAQRENVHETQIRIPKRCHPKLVALIEASADSALLVFGTSIYEQADSHLVCVQDLQSDMYSTTVFTINDASRKCTAASFVVLNASSSISSQLQSSIIEDGVMLRVRTEVMEAICTKLKTAQNYRLETEDSVLDITWISDVEITESRSSIGRHCSAVDGRVLNHLQYKHLRITADMLNCSTLDQTTRSSLRLAEVVILTTDTRQSMRHWFEQIWTIGKELESHLAITLQPFALMLKQADLNRISIRIRVGPDGAEYELGRWPENLQDEFVCWQVTMDDVLVPVIYKQAANIAFNVQAELILTVIALPDD